MERELWPSNGLGPSHDVDRFLFLLSLVVAVLGVLGLIVYVALR